MGIPRKSSPVLLSIVHPHICGITKQLFQTAQNKILTDIYCAAAFRLFSTQSEKFAHTKVEFGFFLSAFHFAYSSALHIYSRFCFKTTTGGSSRCGDNDKIKLGFCRDAPRVISIIIVRTCKLYYGRHMVEILKTRTGKRCRWGFGEL